MREVLTQPGGKARHGTTHLVMTPLEFLQRLAALIPRPRLHLIRFYGVLAKHFLSSPDLDIVRWSSATT